MQAFSRPWTALGPRMVPSVLKCAPRPARATLPPEPDGLPAFAGIRLPLPAGRGGGRRSREPCLGLAGRASTACPPASRQPGRRAGTRSWHARRTQASPARSRGARSVILRAPPPRRPRAGRALAGGRPPRLRGLDGGHAGAGRRTPPAHEPSGDGGGQQVRLRGRRSECTLRARARVAPSPATRLPPPLTPLDALHPPSLPQLGGILPGGAGGDRQAAPTAGGAGQRGCAARAPAAHPGVGGDHAVPHHPGQEVQGERAGLLAAPPDRVTKHAGGARRQAAGNYCHSPLRPPARPAPLVSGPVCPVLRQPRPAAGHARRVADLPGGQGPASAGLPRPRQVGVWGGGGSGRGWRRGAAATRHALRPHRAATGAQIAVPRNAHPHTAPLPPRFMLQLPAAAGVHHQPAGSCPAAAGRLRQHPAPPAPCGRGRSGHRQHPGGSGGCAEDGRAGHKGGAGRHALSWRLRMWQPRRGGHTLQRRAARGSVQEAPSSAHTRPQHAPSRPSSTPSSAHTRPPPLAATPARRR